VTFSVAGALLEHSFVYPPDQPVTDLFLRTSVSQEAVGASVSLTSLALSQGGVNHIFSAVPLAAAHNGHLGQVSYVWLSGLNPDQNWTLSGEATFDWQAETPSQSDAAFQIGMNSVSAPAPEPRSVALAGIVLLGLAAAARRRIA
jgi:MYXO-CTERM domain-containing protein